MKYLVCMIGMILSLSTAVAEVTPFTENHSNGVIKASGFIQDENGSNKYQVGYWQTWHENGSMRSAGSYELGHLHGNWTNWYKNGSAQSIGRYDYGSMKVVLER